jgi:valyl-tRNA synthetase
MVSYKHSLRWLSYQNRITDQLRRLGGSYDWSRVAFTMDDVSVDFLPVSKCRLANTQ